MQASRRRTPNTKCVTPARWGNRGAEHGAESNTEFFTDAPGDGCIGKTTEDTTMSAPKISFEDWLKKNGVKWSHLREQEKREAVLNWKSEE